MQGLIVSWCVAEGIVIYRSAKERIPPRPGQLLVTSGAFICLAVLAEFAPELALMIGVGIDVAALFQVWPGSGSVAPAAAVGADIAVAALA